MHTRRWAGRNRGLRLNCGYLLERNAAVVNADSGSKPCKRAFFCSAPGFGNDTQNCIAPWNHAGGYSRAATCVPFVLRHHSPFQVRRNSSPSDIARLELVYSPTEFVASSSNFGAARSTKTSPAWFTA